MHHSRRQYQVKFKLPLTHLSVLDCISLFCILRSLLKSCTCTVGLKARVNRWSRSRNKSPCWLSTLALHRSILDPPRSAVDPFGQLGIPRHGPDRRQLGKFACGSWGILPPYGDGCHDTLVYTGGEGTSGSLSQCDCTDEQRASGCPGRDGVQSTQAVLGRQGQWVCQIAEWEGIGTHCTTRPARELIEPLW